VTVLTGPTGDGDRLVDVICDGQVVSVFFLDLKMRGTEVKDPRSSDDSEADESATAWERVRRAKGELIAK
jgi:hypothetical protein